MFYKHKWLYWLGYIHKYKKDAYFFNFSATYFNGDNKGEKALGVTWLHYSSYQIAL